MLMHFVIHPPSAVVIKVGANVISATNVYDEACPERVT